VDSIGGNLDAFTAKELVCFNTKVLDDHLSLAFDVLAELVLHPLFRDEDIEKEKGVILEEIKMEADSPDYLVHEIFSSNFWKDHPLGKPILGTPQSVKKFSQDTVRQFYSDVYAPANLIVTAAGNLTHNGLVALAREHLEALPPGGPAPADDAPATHARIALRNKKSLEQVHLCLGVPSYPLPHEERFACYVLNTLLGGGMSSRLFQNIRERQGLAYAVFSELNPYRDTGCLSIYAGTSVESAGKVVESITKEFRDLKQDPVPDEELRRAKDHLKGSLMLSLESTSSRMSNLARQEMYFGKFFTLDELVESIETVTAADVQRIAQTFFDPRQIAVTVLGNLEAFRLGREDLAC
jgi:predicted Zn-dependent peptidase